MSAGFTKSGPGSCSIKIVLSGPWPLIHFSFNFPSLEDRTRIGAYVVFVNVGHWRHCLAEHSKIQAFIQDIICGGESWKQRSHASRSVDSFECSSKASTG